MIPCRFLQRILYYILQHFRSDQMSFLMFAVVDDHIAYIATDDHIAYIATDKRKNVLKYYEEKEDAKIFSYGEKNDSDKRDVLMQISLSFDSSKSPEILYMANISLLSRHISIQFSLLL
jgi:hypothetical protein